jgi:hypothetical protein
MSRNILKKSVLFSLIVLGVSHLTYAQASDFERSESKCDFRDICIGDKVDTKDIKGGVVSEHDALGRVVIAYYDPAKKTKAFAAVFSEDITSKKHSADFKDWFKDESYRFVYGKIEASSKGVFAKDYEACGMNLPKGTAIRPDNSAYQALLEKADQYCIVNKLHHCRLTVKGKRADKVKEGHVFKMTKGYQCTLYATVYGLEDKPAPGTRINDSTGQTEATGSSEPQSGAGSAY